MKVHGLKLFFFYFLSACVCDNWQLCLVRVNSLITHLQLKKMPVNVCVYACCNSLAIISAVLLICIMKKSIWKVSVNRLTQNIRFWLRNKKK